MNMFVPHTDRSSSGSLPDHPFAQLAQVHLLEEERKIFSNKPRFWEKHQHGGFPSFHDIFTENKIKEMQKRLFIGQS